MAQGKVLFVIVNEQIVMDDEVKAFLPNLSKCFFNKSCEQLSTTICFFK